MKRRFTIVAATLALLAIFIAPMGMKGQNTYTIGWGAASGATGTYTNFTATSGTVNGILSFTCQKNDGTTDPAYNSNNQDLRLYYHSGGNGGSITITPATGITITGAVMTTSTSPSVKYTVDGGTATSVTASNNTYTVTGISATQSLKFQNVNTSNTQLRIKTIALTYSTGSGPTTYTVTYDANGGTGTMTDSNSPYTAGATVTVLDNGFTRSNFEFDHWNTEADDSGTDYDEGDTFTINAHTTMYAQWTANGGLATLTATNLELTGSYPSSTVTKTIDGITYEYYGLMKSNNNIQAQASNGTVYNTTAFPGDITSVVITHYGTGRSTTISGSADGTNWTQVATGNGSLNADFSTYSFKYFKITRGSSNAAYWTGIDITYSTGGSSAVTTSVSIDDTNLTNTDVYVNTAAGTLTATVLDNNDDAISGATVTWSSSDPSIATINASGVVTLVATGTTTITASYAGVANQYQASSTTYSLTVTSSAPVPDVTFVAETDTGSTYNNGTPDSMTKGGVTVSSTDAAFATEQYRLYSGSTTTISAPGYTITRIVFTGVDNSKPVSGLSVNNNNGTYSVNNNVGTWIGSASSVVFSASAQARVGTIAIWMTATSTPTIAANPATLNDFFYLASTQGPSAVQTVSVSGVQLANGITVAVGNNSNFEISQAENSGYTNSITLAQLNGSVASTTIYVRMKGNLQAGNYSDNLSLTSTGATTINMALAGEVVTPMTVAQAITAIDNATGNSVTGAYVAGIVSQIDSYNSNYHSITYWISDDGGTTTQLEVFGGKGLDGANFSALSDLTVGDEVVVYGNLTLYNNSVYEFESNNHLVYYSHTLNPVINANNITLAYNETEGSISYSVVNSVEGTNLTASCSASWISSLTVSANAVTFFATQNDNQAPRTANITLSYTGAADKIITVTQTNFTASSGSGSGQFVRITSLNDLTDGSKVIIAARHNSTTNSYYAMPSAFSPSHGKVDGVQFNSTTSGNDEVIPASLFDVNGVNYYYWTVNIINNNNSQDYTFTNASGDTIACLSGETDFYWSRSYDYEWRIASSTAGASTLVPGYTGFVITNRDVTNRAFAFNGSKFGNYNTTNINGSYNFYLDFFVETGAAERHALTINRYTESGVGQNANPSNGWYLIASPVQGVTPSATNGFLTSAYDLYRFDQVGDVIGNEWLNYEVTPFNLISGQGYLYASSTDTELVFEGASYTGNGQVTLFKKDCSNASGNFEGWNLVGNPFPHTAYIDRDCYVMNQNRNQIIATSNREVAIMQGLFVVANSDGEKMTFSTTNPNNSGSKVVMNIIDNQGVADRAIVRFGEGQQLPKFQLFGNTTKVYFTEGHQDYAVVRSANEGELPVNFKASRNGRYTMSVDIEDLDMNYLHLIDNKTGMDVDLLQTPSYTFQASTGDYESRFRLVFDANAVYDNNTVANFAFFNGSEWVVSNMGNATLQVVDVTGRVLSSQTISGNANVNINQAAGIYMLRLVNGENVQVQKVVVR